MELGRPQEPFHLRAAFRFIALESRGHVSFDDERCPGRAGGLCLVHRAKRRRRKLPYGLICTKDGHRTSFNKIAQKRGPAAPTAQVSNAIYTPQPRASR